MDGVGHTARRIIENYIQRNPGVKIDKLNSIFGNRTVFPADKVPDKKYHFAGYPVDTSQGRLYITNQWATKSDKGKKADEGWRAFQETAKTLGYTISECRFVAIGDDDTRDWDACRHFGFLSAGGKSGKGHLYAQSLKKLRIGTIVFAFLLSDSSGKKGFVGIGEVTAMACPMRDFSIGGTGLLDSKDEFGKIYKEKFSKAQEVANDNDECEWCLRVRWIKTFPREEAAEGNWIRGHIVLHRTFQANMQNIKDKFEEN